jgi:hypothetical protein
MSRGCGQVQRMLFTSVVNAKRPITYAEIVGGLLQASGVNDPHAKLRSDRERAIRRALKGLCDRDLLSTLGSGRPGGSYRYTLNTICVVCLGEAPDGKTLSTGKGTHVCFGCAGAIAQAYVDMVLPEHLKQTANRKVEKAKAGAKSKTNSQ